MTEPAEAALTELFRDEWPRLIGAAARITGDLQAAEDVVQETLLTALDRWPLQGVPDRPGAWLMTACRNRARNLARDAGREQRRLAALRPSGAGSLDGGSDIGNAGPPGIADDRLRLIALCCHPLLTADAQVALTLRLVGGLTTEEIARGFHVAAATMAQRILRARRLLREHRIALADDDPDARQRLPAVLDVIYLIFNEGYLAAAGDTLTRGDLAFEAYRLACLLTELVPDEAQAWALRALVCFQLSRWATRTGPGGTPLTLDQQDRGRWNRPLIDDGVRALGRARRDGRTPLLLQAELAACHATATTFEATDWVAIVALYDELGQVQDTPVVALNRAVAVAMRDGPAAALPAVDQLCADPALAGGHRVWAVRADLNRRLGRRAAAAADYDQAIALAGNAAERRYLTTARGRLTAGPDQKG